ncbi:hypothetical protein [Singulisphaera acidiphila]|uniref:Uncharacterized protein n=1 Tax=Singulisphaera acidiphila (strain ATCC BAA-1392 / DSM 18658 / VKM B-2454 / MOB10) TaxID=886293 RepID=L0DG69_SINAD|nr:hypothetical protein [Singulisphaera acidiphila]AGA27845.1 hypothetical protein Sinac_3595 [Singulisphaera acidiphila DSM 18658]
MSAQRLRLWLTPLILVVPLEFVGCAPADSGTIDLKKKAESSPSGPSKPREFRPGDLEER